MRRFGSHLSSCLLVAALGSAPAESVEITVEASSGGCRAARVVATPSAAGVGSEDPVSALDWQIEVPGRRVVGLDTEVGWRVSAYCPGSWAPEVHLAPGFEKRSVQFLFVAAGRLGGRFAPAERVPRGEEVEVRIRLQPTRRPGGEGWRVVKLTCPLDRDRFECDVPAGELDARLAIDGFAPHYAWGSRIPEGDLLDLGSLELIEGASVAGWVKIVPGSDEGAADGEEKAVVSANPVVQGAVAEPEQRRLEIRGARTPVDDRGFFQLAGLEAGSYEVSASAAGHSPARISPLSLARGEERVIQGLIELEPLVTLEAFLDPPQDVAGRPWWVRLLGESRSAAGAVIHQLVAHEPATMSGHWSQDGLAVGRYLVRVEDDRGSIWHEEPIELTPTLGPLFLQLDAVAVEGEVLLGDEPVKAEVVFGTTTRVPSLRMPSDDEGRFSGVLPHEGEWPLEVALAGRPPQALDPVEVWRGPSGVAKVSLHLPSTLLSGEVVTEEGEPVAGAEVLVIREDAKASPAEREVGIEYRRRREASLTSDRDGRFEIEGLLPARLFVVAESAIRASEWVRVDLAEGSPADSIRLILRERSNVAGHVLSPEGPVPGAAVAGFSRGTVAPIDLRAQDVTEADGRFTIELSAGTRIFDLLVAPAGGDVVLRRMPVGRDPIAIEIAHTDSRLVLEGIGPGTTISHGGAELPIETLASVVFPLGRIDFERRDRVAFEGFEPGPYSVCPQDPGAGCASGVLAPGSELILHGPDVGSQDGSR